ncbi:cytochrome P450 [Gemmatimonas sp.]|uniref:cytochrome P450 n=1 Tax=Gemmatimonas sp. TaxID=1962908 RepID=UPI003983D37B
MTTRAAWTLYRYADVHAALCDDRLVPYGVATRGDATHIVVRDAVARELPPALMARWRASFGGRADRILATLSIGERVDLMRDVAQPWAYEAVVQVLAIPPQVAAASLPAAATLFEESAIACGGAPTHALTQAAVQLAAQLDAYGGAGTVQSFVAITQTVPALVGAAMLALLQHPAQLAWLRAHGDAAVSREVLAMATNELLRFTGPSRAVFRIAVAPVTIRSAAIQIGDAVVLLLAQANRDPDVFINPEQLDVQRAEPRHLAFGVGAHGCVGAGVVRLLLQEAIAAFVRSSREFDLDERDGVGVTWLDGFALRAPRSIPTIVRERRATP